MFAKTLTLAAAAAGYVLGARAGRERFDQIKEQADRLKNSPQMQKAASDAQDVMADKAPAVKDKVASMAKKSDDAGSTTSHDLPGTVANPASASTAQNSPPKHPQANL